jgi:hypothetical protein
MIHETYHDIYIFGKYPFNCEFGSEPPRPSLLSMVSIDPVTGLGGNAAQALQAVTPGTLLKVLEVVEGRVPGNIDGVNEFNPGFDLPSHFSENGAAFCAWKQ